MAEPIHTKPGSYYGAFVVIAILTILNISLSFSTNMGAIRPYLHFGIAIVQVATLTVIFMHLRGADGMTWLTALSGLFFVALMFLFIITDFLTRHYAAY